MKLLGVIEMSVKVLGTKNGAVPNISSQKVRTMIFVALALILPFALFEIYVVLKFGFSEPYSYWFSVPSGVVSFFVLQFALCYSVVKGWVICNMPRNYLLLVLWVGSFIVLCALPLFFSKGPMS